MSKRKRKVRILTAKKYVRRRRVLFAISVAMLLLISQRTFLYVASALSREEGEEVYEEIIDHRDKPDTMSLLNEKVPLFNESIESFRYPINAELTNRGIPIQYTNVLLGILAVECGGRPNDYGDPFQSSESRGLEPNTIEDANESMVAAVDLFERLLNTAEERNLDIFAVIQSYNYGAGYMNFLNSTVRGYSFATATEFAAIMADGETTEYSNPLSNHFGETWRYKYGNRYYVPLVLEQLGYSYSEIEEMCMR